MGVGQRVIKGAAHVGGVLTVAETPLLREILIPIYESLEVEFQPETAGGIADFDASLGVEEVMTAMLEVLSEDGYDLDPQRFDASMRQEAEELIPLHLPERNHERSAVLRASRSDHKTLVQGEQPEAEDS
jgi:hypothetical protein